MAHHSISSYHNNHSNGLQMKLLASSSSQRIKTLRKDDEKICKKSIAFDTDELSLIYKENSQLRQENRALKKEIGILKSQQEKGKKRDGLVSIDERIQISDMRDTIKKESREIRKWGTHEEIIQKKYGMYEQVIEKMEKKVKALTHQKKDLEEELKELKDIITSNTSMSRKSVEKSSQESSKIKERVNEIMDLYCQLESKMNESEVQWAVMKERWTMERSYYLHRIEDLQKIIGYSQRPQPQENHKKEFWKYRRQ